MEPLLGQIQAFAFNFAPRGWMQCNGQLLQISSYSALYSLIGNTYGGDGRVTFALPDLRSRSGVHIGNGPGLDTVSWGERGGAILHHLTNNELPSHNHTSSLNVSSSNSSQDGATANASIATPGTTDGRAFTPTKGFNTATPNVTLNPNSVITGNSGGNAPFNIRNPFLGINYCIAVIGIFPSRS